jgi:proline dehydrogenase
MLRAILIYLSQASWARKIVTSWGFAWRTASRFIAGETLDDAIHTVRLLSEKGIHATLDHLGEHTTSPEQARKATEDILEIYDAIDASDVCASVSIKLTQIGLSLDEELCEQNLRRIVTYAKEKNNWLRIDMEDSPWVDVTLKLYNRLRNDGLMNTGVVIQSYLYRSMEDVEKIMEHGGRVRLCKGAYKELPEVAYPKKQDVDENFDRLTKQLVDGAIAKGSPEITEDCRVPPIPAIASHDPERLAYARAYAEKSGLPKGAIEFQMLNGIRRDLQEQIAADGYPVRVYVPYGSEWYPYFVRRLAERPANLWFFVSNFFRN